MYVQKISLLDMERLNLLFRGETNYFEMWSTYRRNGASKNFEVFLARTLVSLYVCSFLIS